VLAEISGPEDLASGVGLEQAPGVCRVVDLDPADSRRFAWAVGPHSAKAVQHPAEQILFEATVDQSGVHVEPVPPTADDPRPVAVIGLRPCDVAAVGVLDNVLDGGRFGGVDPLVVVVNCTDPGGTCFCTSMGTGPALDADRASGADLVLWERTGTDPEYLVTHVSERMAPTLDAVARSEATAEDASWASQATTDAASRMGRVLSTDGLAERLTATLDSERWDDIAQRCLSCGNCTMVCPTCFCSSVHDTASLDGSTVARTQRWDSCFSLDHSYIHGGSVRSGTDDRYRQWLTHKLSSWWAQFGESGCVGCGRCISWCPVGIDLVEEANLLSAEADLDPGGLQATAPGDPTSATMSITEVLVRRRGEV